jgi:hypothetical protein
MSASNFYKRFPVRRRIWCLPVTSVRTNGAKNGSRQARAAEQTNGEGTPPTWSGSAPVDLNIKRIKGVVEK